MRRPTTIQISVLATALLAYVVVFELVFRTSGQGMSMAVVIPVIAVAWHFGCLAGICAGFMSLVLNCLMFALHDPALVRGFLLQGTHIIGTSSLIVIGGVVGHMRNLTKELRLHRNRLNDLVQQKTADLEASNQQLKAAEKQVRAAFEQLQASNQQMLASQEELRRTNDYLDNIIDSSLDCIIVSDNQGTILRANKYFKEVTGYSDDEILGKNVAAFTIKEPGVYETVLGEQITIDQDFFEKAYEAIEKFQKEDRILNWQGYFIKKDGRLVPTEQNLVYLFDDNGARMGAVGIGRDITERKRIADSLQREKEKLEAASMAGKVALWEWDIASGRLEWSGAIDSMLGYGPGQLPRTMRAWEQHVHPDDFKRVSAELADHLERKRPYDTEYRIRRSDGLYVWWHDTGAARRGSDGKAYAMSGACIDIHARKTAENQLREREQRLSSIVDTAVDAIVTVDSIGRIVAWNHAAETIYGYTADEMIGQPANILLPERFRERDVAGMQAAFAARSIEPFNKNVQGWSRRKDGSEFPTEVSQAMWQAGSDFFMTAIVRDISERKQAEAERLLLSTAIEQADETVVIMDAEGTALYVNPAVERATGRKPQAAIGVNQFANAPPTYDKDFFNAILQGLHNGKPWRGVLTYHKIDGTKAMLDQTVSPIFDSSGKLINILSISRDVTREHNLEAQLMQAQKMEAIGTLAGGIAHDFNNILAAILGYTEMAVLKLPADSPAADNLQQVLVACDRARTLVKQILLFSRKGEQELKPLQIGLLVKEAVKLLRASIPTTIDMHHKISDEHAIINADPTQIHQLLINLCTNAAHAMEESGGLLDIRLDSLILQPEDVARYEYIHAGPYVRLIVSDTGSGIDPLHMGRIFEPFFTTKELGRGTGMGLAVVHGIVKSHQGAIDVESQLGKGTTFRIFLPRIVSKPEPVQEKHENLPMGTETILYVEDEAPLMDLGNTMLSSLGYSVICTQSSLQALDLFRSNPEKFNCIITDMTMPHMTGYELAKNVMQIRDNIPVILCTGYSEKVSKEQAMALGIKAFLMKPLMRQELGEVVRKVLDSCQLSY